MPKKKSQPKHIHFTEGAKLMIKFVDGRREVDRFVKVKQDNIFFKRLGKVSLGDIAMLTRGGLKKPRFYGDENEKSTN